MRVRGLTRGGYLEQVRGYCRELGTDSHSPMPDQERHRRQVDSALIFLRLVSRLPGKDESLVAVQLRFVSLPPTHFHPDCCPPLT